VESWFARIERDCIARGIFTSTTDLTRKLLRFIRLHNENLSTVCVAVSRRHPSHACCTYIEYDPLVMCFEVRSARIQDGRPICISMAFSPGS